MASNTVHYPAATIRRRGILLGAAVVLLIVAGFMQKVIDPQRLEYHKGEGNTTTAYSGLNNEFLLLPLLGFREAAAGLLWVRCDEFFHSGDYDAILPLVRLITWLDPHADNVYVTGAWHLDYNFTDSSERSDRRYIAPALALLDEGIKNNENIYDIKFEKGWQSYDKLKDFATAEEAFKMAIAGPNNNEMFKGPKDADNEGFWPYAAPLKVLHMLAHTYEKRGRIPEALATWNRALERSTAILKKKKNDFGTMSLHDAEKHNYAENLQRYRDRYTSTGHDHNNPLPYPAVEITRVGNKGVPRDVAFSAKIDVPRAQVFKVSGLINLADGGRVDVRITDWDYKDRVADPNLRALEPPDLEQTILIDSISIRKAKFSRELDMSKDPKMYSFSNKAGLYKVVLTFNARTTSPHIQDFVGWSGEGMTDANPSHVFVVDMKKHPELVATKYIDTPDGIGPNWDGVTIPWNQFGQPPRNIRITFKITKAQVMGNKPITNADIVPNDPDTTILLK